MNIKLEYTQLVLFSPGIVITNKSKTASSLNDILSNILDSDPMILPLPDDAPPEIPRIQLKSKDGHYELKIANNRIDFMFRYREDEQETTFPVPDLYEKFNRINQYFGEELKTQFTRSAMITQYVIELEKFPGAEHLLSKYIQEEAPLKTPYEFELHSLRKESIAGFNVNKWTRIRSARKITDPENNKFILFLIDINTLPEEEYEFNQEALQKFLDESSKVVNNTIEIHLKRMEE